MHIFGDVDIETGTQRREHGREISVHHVGACERVGTWFLNGKPLLHAKHAHVLVVSKEGNGFSEYWAHKSHIWIHDEDQWCRALPYANVVALAVTTITTVLYQHNVFSPQGFELVKHGIASNAVVINNNKLYFLQRDVGMLHY